MQSNCPNLLKPLAPKMTISNRSDAISAYLAEQMVGFGGVNKTETKINNEKLRRINMKLFNFEHKHPINEICTQCNGIRQCQMRCVTMTF